jgi:hypothetical protein
MNNSPQRTVSTAIAGPSRLVGFAFHAQIDIQSRLHAAPLAMMRRSQWNVDLQRDRKFCGHAALFSYCNGLSR